MATKLPRRPRPGHTTSCPTPHLYPRVCVCRSERIGMDPDPTPATVATAPALAAAARGLAVSLADLERPPAADPAPVSVVGPGPVLTACPNCFAPTTTDDDHVCRW